jgi:lipid-A-disaccharide synthase
MTTVLVSAGDASGDLHAAAFVEALRSRVPELRVVGIGGVEMEKAGVELLVNQRELAVGGLVEVISSVRRVFAAWRRMRQAIDAERPDLVVLVDSPDLNLPFARSVQRAGIPTLYYVSPQVWAWRRWRIRKIARRVDRLAVIFPFERDIYAHTGLPVDFVGHPLVERMCEFAALHDRATARAELDLDPERPLVLLLPGSRRNELRHGFDLKLESARVLHARRPEVAFAVAVAPTLEREEVERRIAEAGLPADLRLDVIQGRTYEAVRAADVALAKPGTITVEVALLDRPMVVAARVHPLSAFVARRLVHVPSFTMPNLIAGAPVIPEFLQEAARPERIALALESLLSGPAREIQLARLARVRRRLGEGGAAARAASIAAEMIDGAARA